jgi:hypothetical protein
LSLQAAVLVVVIHPTNMVAVLEAVLVVCALQLPQQVAVEL